jgi:hypothetical protein
MKADHLHVYRPIPSTTAYSVPRYSIIFAELMGDGFRSRPSLEPSDPKKKRPQLRDQLRPWGFVSKSGGRDTP